jgi:serine/threonine protein kinase
MSTERSRQIGDEQHRREVESLTDTVTATQLAAGAQLGPYRIEAQLGAGGMGQVYEARDTRLGRAVAIKILAAKFSDRFEREARAISALNHPHICTLYDVGPNYLVMELVEGETLAARRRKGPLPMDLVLRYGAQIAEALAAAHAQGITHRDLKPGNVIVTKAGIKVLDFGLAKTAAVDDTLTASHVVMGTPAYMAPEQAEGKTCDSRTDIYALGLVLYEMATAKRVAQERSMEGLPAQFAHVVERCLEPEPENRWQSARDVKAELEWAARSPPAPSPIRKAPKRWIWAVAALASAAILLAGIFVYLRVSRRSTEPAIPARFTLSFEGLTSVSLPQPSPDGTTLLFSAQDASGRRSLWLRRLNSGAARQLPGTEDVQSATWTIDGRSIGFYSRGKLRKISSDGHNLQTIADVERVAAAGLAWNASGDILLGTGNRVPLSLLRESGGGLQPLTRLDVSRTENSHRWVQFLPDGRRFLFVARCGLRENNALYLGSLDSGETRQLITAQSNASYVPPRDGRPGALLYVRDGALVEHAFDGERVAGQPSPVVDNIEYNPAGAYGYFSVSADGRMLVFQRPDPGPVQLTWFDRKGRAAGTLGPPGIYRQPRIAPDGARVLYERPDEQGGNRDTWYMETSRGVAQRLTTDPANDWNPAWAPNGRGILFGSDRRGGPNHAVYIKKSLDPGAGEEVLFDLADRDYAPEDWSLDGKWLVFHVFVARPGQGYDMWVLPFSGERTPFAFLATRFSEHSARFSPDAKWIAYVSDESGQSEVYVRPFSGRPASQDDKIRISTNGGGYPAWHRDGSELFFMGGDGTIYSTKTAEVTRPGAAPQPVALFPACPNAQRLPGAPPWQNPYDVAPDGRFLIACGTSRPAQFEVMLNWRALK